ncbi:MAG: hypothetical protein A2076_01650 [Geobacteraceae bacterium GWC2_53_11]|nr:MAG: hypothetical protein A2076_01650 [Geobacteraceae bacterium GWC2_53_11]
MKHNVTIEIDTDKLSNYTDEYLTTLWHVSQANPAANDDHEAARIAESIGIEIIRRWLKVNPGEMYLYG